MRRLRQVRLVLGFLVLAVAVGYLVHVVDTAALGDVWSALVDSPDGLAVAIGCYASAFLIRAWCWRRTLPGLGWGQSWAALHVSLLGNHVLPLRLGEVLRVTSVLRRTDLEPRAVTASAVTLRGADLVAVIGLAAVIAPGVLTPLGGGWLWAVAVLVAVVLVGGLVWTVRLSRVGVAIRLPSPLVLTAVVSAWVLESVVVWEIARIAGHRIDFGEAVAVTAVTIAVQAVAVAPGGIGSYEAAATAALVGVGLGAEHAFAIALTTHAVKTGYSLAVGAAALLVPEPSYWGRLRLSRDLPERPVRSPVAADAPIVAILPVHNEESTVGEVVAGLPRQIEGRPVVVLVIDDGSTDGSAQRARAAGAEVVSQPRNLGLGAAVRRGLQEASARAPAAVVYLDADAEYRPSDAPAVLAPVLSGAADYVAGSRFTGRIDRMLRRRRFGNRVLTTGLRWVSRNHDITDGQSGYRAFSADAAAHAEVIHDYNYAQVLTLDLLAKGYRYAEVPIGYSFRSTGESFVKLGRYLRRVLPAVYRELNAPAVPAPVASRTGGVAASSTG